MHPRYPQRPEEGIRSPESGIVAGPSATAGEPSATEPVSSGRVVSTFNYAAIFPAL